MTYPPRYQRRPSKLLTRLESARSLRACVENFDLGRCGPGSLKLSIRIAEGHGVDSGLIELAKGRLTEGKDGT